MTVVLSHYSTDEPAHGQIRVSNELRRKGIFVSASSVRSVWLRNDLANFKQRLKALEVKVDEDGIILTESQVLLYYLLPQALAGGLTNGHLLL